MWLTTSILSRPKAVSKGAGLQRVRIETAPFDTLLHYALRQAQGVVPQLLRMLPFDVTCAAFRQHFVKPGLIEAEYGRIYGQLMDDRHGGDYDLETTIEPEQAAADVEHAHQFVARVRQYLQQEGWL